jgi:hypothetical protein
MIKNTTYILQGNLGYDGDVILGVYSSEESARKAAANYQAAVESDEDNDLTDFGGEYLITIMNLDSAATDEKFLRSSNISFTL